jgi:predicted HTH domain antitoxin
LSENSFIFAKQNTRIMKTISINIPEMSDLDSRELTMIVASQLYEGGKLSLGQAADVAGYTKRTFAELLGKYKVSIFNYPFTDLLKDVANA